MAALLALMSSVLWGTSDFLGGVMARKRPPLAIVGFGMLFGLITMVIVSLFGDEWSSPLTYFPYAISASLAGLIGLWAFYTALAIGRMGLVSPIASLGIVVPLAAGLVQGDLPTAIQAVGVVAAIMGLGLVVMPERNELDEPSTTPTQHRKSLILAGVSAVCFGVSLASIAQGSQTSPIMTMLVMRLCTVTIMIVVALAARSLGGVQKKDLPMLAVIGLFDVSANLTYGLSSEGGEFVIAAVLGSLYPVMTALLAWWFLKERLRSFQYVGVTLALAGVILMSM